MSAAIDSFWTQERRAKVFELYIERGLQAADVAAQLGAASGHAVMALAARMNWKRGERVPWSTMRAPPALCAPLKVNGLRIVELRRDPAGRILNKVLADLGDDECHFPVGPPMQKGEALFCASPLARNAGGDLPKPRYCVSCRPLAFFTVASPPTGRARSGPTLGR